MDTERFDPARHLTKVSGREYLEVKYRLVWLRDTHPDASIETEMVQHQGNNAVFRAKVTLPSGASATGWGQEGSDDFGDYLEKAETKALGRALAALGFGTQFAGYEDGAERGRVVDSPVGGQSSFTPPERRQEAPRQQGSGGRTYPTDKQLIHARRVAEEANLHWDSQANEIIFAATGITVRDGVVDNNTDYQAVYQWMVAHKDSEWVYNAGGHLESVPF